MRIVAPIQVCVNNQWSYLLTFFSLTKIRFLWGNVLGWRADSIVQDSAVMLGMCTAVVLTDDSIIHGRDVMISL